MEKEIIEMYRLSLVEKINEYDKLLQSMIDDYDEKRYQDTLEEKRMIVYCLELLSKLKEKSIIICGKRKRDENEKEFYKKGN